MLGAEGFGAFPEAYGESGEIGCAERGGFRYAGANDGNVEQVCLKLHEQVVYRCAAIHAQFF